MSSLLALVPVALVLVALQATVFEHVTWLGGHPNVVLMLVALLSSQAGWATALLPALIAAPFIDAASGLPLGASVLPMLAVVSLAGMGERILQGTRLLWLLLLAVLATLLSGGITLLEVSLFGGDVNWLQSLLFVIAPSAVLNSIVVLLLVAPLDYARRRGLFRSV